MQSAVDQPGRGKFELFEHSWAGLGVFVITWILVLMVFAVLIFGFLGLSSDSPMAGFVQSLLSHLLTLFIIVPYVIRLPKGKRTFIQYLDDIRLNKIQPLGRLLLLAVSCFLILAFCQVAGSLVFRLSRGLTITWEFIRLSVLDFSGDLPPRSPSLLVSFPSIFEEVAFRGVILTLFLSRYSEWKSILISAVAFGGMHVFNLVSGRELAWVLGQIVWASILGIFYGYLVIRTGSLLPAMIVHYLGNVFVGSLTGYIGDLASIQVQALYGIVFSFGLLPTSLMILWTRFFTARMPFSVE